MAILAVGVRYDLNTKQRQAVVVITDDDGKGHPDHLAPHAAHAEHEGHGWLVIDPEVYSTFNKVNSQNFKDFAPTLDEHLARVLK